MAMYTDVAVIAFVLLVSAVLYLPGFIMQKRAAKRPKLRLVSVTRPKRHNPPPAQADRPQDPPARSRLF